MRYRLKVFRAESGASYIESAIAIPIALVGMFAFSYFAVALIALGILDHAANRTMRSITTHPAFEKPPSGECGVDAPENDPFCQALSDFHDKARGIPLGTFFGLGEEGGTLIYLQDNEDNPSIIMPQALQHGDQSYDDAIKNQPVVVTLTARMRSPLPWLGDIPIVSKATGFIELRTTPNLPVKVDCNGYREGHPDYRQLPCDCSHMPNSTWSTASQQCHVCEFERVPPLSDGSAPVGYVKWSGFLCACPTTSKCREIYPNSYLMSGGTNPNNRCRCGCHTNEGWMSNPRTGGQVTFGPDIPEGGCVCAPAPSLSEDGSYGQYPSPAFVIDNNVDPENVIKFKPTRVVTEFTTESSNKCYCEKLNGGYLSNADCEKIWAPIIGPGKVAVYNQSRCTCICKNCPSGASRIGSGFPSDDCMCKLYNITNNTCYCADPPTCQSPATVNNDCQCECPDKSCGYGVIKDPDDGCKCNNCPHGTFGSPPNERCLDNQSDIGG